MSAHDRTRTTQTRLDAELRKRLWACFDAARALIVSAEREANGSVAAWEKLHRAVADVPESQRPKV